MERHAVLRVWQLLTKSQDTKAPGPGAFVGLLEVPSDAGDLAARIAKRTCSALEAEAALVGFVVFGDVGVTRNINAAAGSPAKNSLILKPCHDSGDPRAADVIHEIAPDLIRTVC